VNETIRDIRQMFDAYRRVEVRDPGLQRAAVLIPLFPQGGALHLLLTQRTETVEHHKGQISFPGGGRHPEDENLWVTAIRETEEEIGVPRESVRLLGALPKMLTVTDFEVSPFVGAIPYPVAFRPEPGEVESILEIPLSYLLDPQVVEEKILRWKGRDVPTLVYHYHGHAIWGATARILADFLEALRGGPAPVPG
jgi:8-oxo-dGTP pyrophosphatase MutT (NUDIX family)